MENNKIIAAYARVSSEKQAQQGTIGSQITALKERIGVDEHTLSEDMLFLDDGVSGTTLIRPALERLRDTAAGGVLEKLYVLAPDRLSRKYAHQMLLMEELAACGVKVIFLNHAIGSSPEETMLLQMQGMIAEYERAKIMERNRRGKLHAARLGNVGVLSGAPYGYRYIRKQIDGTPAQYIVELSQAATVRYIFNLIGVERQSIGEVVRRLAEKGIPSQTGKPRWDRSVIWGMLQNPAYMGYAAFGKTKACPPEPGIRPHRHSSEVLKKGCSTKRTDPNEQIRIPVPPIVSESVFQAVQEQLEENRKSARQRKRGAAYLLQGLTVCAHCRYAYYGKKVSKVSAKGKQPYAYYRCIGSDAYRYGGKAICDNKQVRTEQLDDIVWEQVTTGVFQESCRLKFKFMPPYSSHYLSCSFPG
jgi:site-specific DNA recombinase